MRLLWQGRTWEAGAQDASARVLPATCSVVERFGERVGAESGGRLLQGDALDVLRALEGEGLAGRVQLAYVDPPYFSQTDYQHEARLDGRADGRVHRQKAYGDRWTSRRPVDEGPPDEGIGAYLDMLAPRLEGLARLLAPTGTLWVQLDWRAAYLARVILDEIFGRGGFKNEVVWKRAPNLGRQAASGQFGRTLDTLIVYGGPKAKLVPPTRLEPIEESAVRWDDAGRPFTTAPRGDYTDDSIAKLDAEGRIHRTASGKVYVKYFLVQDAHGVWCRERRVDALWTDVAPLRHAQTSERTGYPTQKPLSLLERVIASGTKPGDVVVDVFGGSGTTGEAAFRLGRRFILADQSPLAIATARARLLRAGAPLTVETCGMQLSRGAEPRVAVEPRADGSLDVELVEPREPLAWAIDDAPGDGPFRCAWHAERRPGARTVPAPTHAHLGGASDGGSLRSTARATREIAVRVFEDDGTVRDARVRAPGVTHSKKAKAVRSHES